MRKNQSKWSHFLAFVVPSLLAYALSGIYGIVDGFFVGNRVGDAGLSAINIAYPISALIMALGTGIGMGGAVSYSIHTGAGHKDRAADYMRGSTFLLIAVSIVCTVTTLLTIDPVLQALGATDDVLALGEDYLQIIAAGAVLQVFGTGIIPLIRNTGNATYAMGTMIAGFLTNIVLDYLFVWEWDTGVAGAAYATIIGQGVAAAGGLVYLIRQKLPMLGLSPNVRSTFKSIGKIAIAPFGIAISPMVSLVLVNRASADIGGVGAVACYAVISYVSCIAYHLLQGVGDGSQPLMSRAVGSGDGAGLRSYRTCAYILAQIVSCICIAFLFSVRGDVGHMFGASAVTGHEAARVMPIFLLGIPCLAISRVTSSSLYASRHGGLSYLLIYTEPAALILFLCILPDKLGQEGVWWSVALSQVITVPVAMLLQHLADRHPLPALEDTVTNEIDIDEARIAQNRSM